MTFAEAKKISDEVWYRDLFRKEELKRFSDEEVASIIQKCMETAEQCCAMFAQQDFRKVYAHYGVRIVTNTQMEATNLLAYYDANLNGLELQSNSIEQFYQRLVAAGLEDVLSFEKLQEMILAHELYHVIEMNEKDIYTYQKIDTRKFLFFTWKKRLVTASEIGAYHFTKLSCQLTFNPRALEEISL
jgi:hypothetical protein